MATNNGYHGWYSLTGNVLLDLTPVIHNFINFYDAARYIVIVIFLSSYRIVQLVLDIVKRVR